MIAQWLLIGALLCVGVYAISQRRAAPLIAFAMLLIIVAGIVVVIAPDAANDVAHFLGIGRGADLIVYLFILATLAAVFNIHLRLRSHQRVTTDLAREIAIHTSRKPGDTS